MCGIFGVTVKDKNKYRPKDFQKFIKILFKLSESRGKEAAGLAVKSQGFVDILKSPLSASAFLKSPEYQKFAERVLEKKEGNGFMSIIGHARLATHGSEYNSGNNQPVIKDSAVGVHNGIIANDQELWEKFSSLKKEFDVDTEVFLALLHLFLKDTGSISSSAAKVFAVIEGSASIAALFNNDYSLLLATNTGSLYFCQSAAQDTLVFGSEGYILEEFIDKVRGIDSFDRTEITQVSPGAGLIIDVRDLSEHQFSFSEEPTALYISAKSHEAVKFADHSEASETDLPKSFQINTKSYILTPETRGAMIQTWQRIYSGSGIKRCSRCLYPSTMPFIEFDESGVCNYCRNHQKAELIGAEALEEIVSKYRRGDGKPDCIVAFSGGRDSSYGLHYVKNVLKMHPIAFTYDWGVMTDLGRRNEARVCGKLGVEHIIISADIRRKRSNVRKNLAAWLKKPELGMVPLLMAGDKQLLYYSQWLRKKTNTELTIYSASDWLEEEPFKIGFCGVRRDDIRFARCLPLMDRLKTIKYYVPQYLSNPSYLNSSLVDSLFAFYSFFLLREKNRLQLFNYIKWDEKELLSTIENAFNWEREEGTSTTWRIDDGTAAFYNYIYMAAAGFSEHDTFRSRQIRDNEIDRETAYNLIKEENKPRFDSTEWYARIIGFDINKAIRVINAIPKLYTS